MGKNLDRVLKVLYFFNALFSFYFFVLAFSFSCFLLTESGHWWSLTSCSSSFYVSASYFVLLAEFTRSNAFLPFFIFLTFSSSFLSFLTGFLLSSSSRTWRFFLLLFCLFFFFSVSISRLVGMVDAWRWLLWVVSAITPWLLWTLIMFDENKDTQLLL